MTYSRIILLSVLFTTLITPNLFSVEAGDSASFPIRFGYPFYGVEYRHSVFDAGVSFQLDRLDLATLNVESSGDLLKHELSLFHPDLVTAGRPIYLSSSGLGPDATRLYWRGRPMRDPWTSRSDFSLIPPGFVGGVRSAAFGSIDGVLAPGELVELLPLDIRSRSPVTSIHHRDGYYDFAPVEFIHARGVSEATYLTGGGFIPSSQGRWEHAAYSGHLLYGEVIRQFDDSRLLRISYMSGKHRAEIPVSDTVRSVKRSDFDASYRINSSSDGSTSLGIYAVEHRTILDGFADHSEGLGVRERGFFVKSTNGNFGIHLRLAGISGDTDADDKFDVAEFEVAGVTAVSLWGADVNLQIGGAGWMPNQAKPQALFSMGKAIPSIGQLKATLKLVGRVPSPQQQFGGLDIESEAGDRVTASVYRSGTVEYKREFDLGEISMNGYVINVDAPILWRIQPDSTVLPHQFNQMTVSGWRGKWKYSSGPYRGGLILTGFSRTADDFEATDYFFPEPRFRLYWEAGWHHLYWDEYFEADILFSGRFLQSYFAYDQRGWHEMGGAYPLDFRMTFRIANFNFYWGLHNWNAYPYYLVPGFRMMHKEEYWGINWLLIG